jgi:glycosyltransferase involved in cell wall biosynthesis
MHLVSVIMPTRNRATSLETAALSVLRQSLQDLELIVVDDASTDTTPSVLDRLADSDRRVRVLRSRVPAGPASSRNDGIEAAEGDIIATCDDDDRWLPGAAETMLEFLASHPNVGAASAWHQVTHVGRSSATTYRGPMTYGEKSLLWVNSPGVSFMFAKRGEFSRDIRYDPRLVTGEDWDLWIRLSMERALRTVPAVVYDYRQYRGERVTAEPENHRDGRRALVQKHGERMSESCRMYHELVLRAPMSQRSLTRNAIIRAASAHPGATSLATALLVASSLASRAGRLRRDPALANRFLTKASAILPAVER